MHFNYSNSLFRSKTWKGGKSKHSEEHHNIKWKVHKTGEECLGLKQTKQYLPNPVDLHFFLPCTATRKNVSCIIIKPEQEIHSEITAFELWLVMIITMYESFRLLTD